MKIFSFKNSRRFGSLALILSLFALAFFSANLSSASTFVSEAPNGACSSNIDCCPDLDGASLRACSNCCTILATNVAEDFSAPKYFTISYIDGQKPIAGIELKPHLPPPKALALDNNI